MSLQFGLKKLISRRWPDVYIFGLTTEKKKQMKMLTVICSRSDAHPRILKRF